MPSDQNQSVNSYSNAATIIAIDELKSICYSIALECGWWNNPETGEPIERNFGEMIALMHSELSEALEADRRDLMSDKIPGFTGIEEEFADVIIRICDLAGRRKLNLGQAIIAKLAYNQTRADHKMENRRKTEVRNTNGQRI